MLRWCEAQLCAHLGLESVCSLLALAHLYEAAELALCCMRFMKAHLAEVVKQPEYAALSSDVLVRFHMYCAGVEPADAAKDHKRKRGAD